MLPLPPGDVFPSLLQKDRVMLLVIWVPNLLAVQRIAFLGGNVHILYVAEMAPNCMLLLLIYTLEQAQKVMISRCNVQFVGFEGYGKKSAHLVLKKRPQDLVLHSSSLQPRLTERSNKPRSKSFVVRGYFFIPFERKIRIYSKEFLSCNKGIFFSPC